jgi:hypothetical protein
MNPDRHLHVVCLDVPYPADYGGACEMYHKVVALSQAGVAVTLHCYDYGRGRQPELDRWCRAVHYYPRNEGHKGLSLKLPYIVASRASPALAERLAADDDPVLFEGIHTTHPLHTGVLAGRRCFVRLHNLEHEYYAMLSRQVRFGIRRFLYALESRLLRPYERSLAGKAVFLTLTEGEVARFRALVPGADARHLPAFTGRNRVSCQAGEGTFCLYHGNLSVPENEQAARWLLREVFGRLELPLVVAGKRPSAALKRLAHSRPHTCIVEDPSARELDDLVRRAQVHVLPSFSETGVKFKLLNAVFAGRHVVADERMVRGTALGASCRVTEGAEGFRREVASLFRTRFREEDILGREALLARRYSDARHADWLISWIWSHGR